MIFKYIGSQSLTRVSVISCKIFVAVESQSRYLDEMLFYGDMRRGEISNYKIQVEAKIGVGLQTKL